MALIEWTERMSVGVDALDHDHQRLIWLLNQLHAVMRSRRTPETGPAAGPETAADPGKDTGAEPVATVGAIVRELVRYTEYHFECEERLMRLARYPAYDDHVRIHRDIRRRMISFEQKFLASPDSDRDVRPLFDFLSDWLMRHILREDMGYRPYLARDADARATAAGPAGA